MLIETRDRISQDNDHRSVGQIDYKLFLSHKSPSHMHEPFVKDEGNEFYASRGNGFKNNYSGPYATRLEIDRTALEMFIKLGRFEGNITLANDSYNRTRDNLDINPDATVSAKRLVPADQKKKDRQRNPYWRTIATGDGWTVLINGQKMVQDILNKPDKKKKDEDRFVSGFNTFLADAVNQCLVREKLTNTKELFYTQKLLTTILQPIFTASFSIADHLSDPQNILPEFMIRLVTGLPIAYAIVDGFYHLDPNYPEMNPRKGWEKLLPPLEVEKVLMGRVYLRRYRDNLVRLKSPKN